MKAFIISFFLVTVFFSISYSQSNYKKTINVTVTNSVTGKPMNETEVIYKGLLGIGKQTQTTNAEGRATFEVTLLVTPMNTSIELNDGSYPTREPTKIPVTLSEGQDVYNVSATFKSSNKGITVMVTDEDDNNQPIFNAKVTFENVNDSRNKINYTDATGSTFEEITMVGDNKAVPILIEKEGYKPYKITVQLSYKSGLNTVSAPLKKDKSTKRLNVKVVSLPDKSPVVGANVTANGKDFEDHFTGSTDDAGVASIIIKTGGDFMVKVKHSNFEEAEEQPIFIKRFGDEEVYNLTFVLKRKQGAKRNLNVYVYEKTGAATTNHKPVPNCGVLVNGTPGTTGTNGIAHFTHVIALGDQAQISVHPSEEYEPAEKQTIIGGGENYRYTPPVEDEALFYIKKKPQKDFELTVQILDESTNNPIGGATAQLRLAESKLTTLNSTNPKGETSFKINKMYLDNAPFRLYAKAKGYEERWSDVTSDFLKTAEEGKYYTIYLKRKVAQKDAKEIKYGPYTVTLDGWKATGLKISKGGSFRVEASGTIIGIEDGKSFEMKPDGTGHWTWFVLKGKIGEKMMDVGSNRGATSEEGGMLELGAPRVARFFEADATDKTGNWTVYVYSKDAIEVSRVSGNAEVKNNNSSIGTTTKTSPDNSATAKTKKALEHLEFLGKLYSGEALPGGRTVDEALSEIKFIVSKYNLEIGKKPAEFNAGLNTVKLFYNSFGNVMPKTKVEFDDFLLSMMNDMRAKIENQQL